MTKQQILEEIRRTAKANGGTALGWKRFETETGIGYHDWYGRFWSRWSDAVREAGLEANRMSEAYSDECLLEKLVLLTRRLQRVPVEGDLRFASRNDSAFPSDTVFRRLGLKAQRVSRVVAYCDVHPGYEDVSTLWREIAVAVRPHDVDEAGSVAPNVGYVYLLKHGSCREYKNGRSAGLTTGRVSSRHATNSDSTNVSASNG